MVICLEQGADLHVAQLMPLPLAVSCFSKIQIGFTFLVPAHLGSPGKGPLNVSVCVMLYTFVILKHIFLNVVVLLGLANGNSVSVVFSVQIRTIILQSCCQRLW